MNFELDLHIVNIQLEKGKGIMTFVLTILILNMKRDNRFVMILEGK